MNLFHWLFTEKQTATETTAAKARQPQTLALEVEVLEERIAPAMVSGRRGGPIPGEPCCS